MRENPRDEPARRDRGEAQKGEGGKGQAGLHPRRGSKFVVSTWSDRLEANITQVLNGRPETGTQVS